MIQQPWNFLIKLEICDIHIKIDTITLKYCMKMYKLFIIFKIWNPPKDHELVNG